MRAGSGGTRRRWGRVLDMEGRPVPGAVVAVTWGTAATPEIGIRTNHEGHFAVALPEGRFQIEARAAAGMGRIKVDSTGDEEIVIWLGKDGASPSGR